MPVKPPSHLNRRRSTWWLVAALALLTLGTAAVVLWMAREAIRNERLAARQLRVESGLVQLRAARAVLATHWENIAARIVRAQPASAQFAALAALEVDGVIVFAADGRATYPALIETPPEPALLQDERWPAVREAEAAGDFSKAAEGSRSIADETALAPEERLAAQQTQVRCRLRDGRNVEAIAAALAPMEIPNGASAKIAGFTLLLVLEKAGEPPKIAGRLAALVSDYEIGLASAPRRMLARRLPANADTFPLLEKETFTATQLADGLVTAPSAGLRETSRADVLAFTPPDRSCALLWRGGTLLPRLASLLPDKNTALIPPGAPPPEDSAASLDAGAAMPGWMLHFVMPSTAGRTFTRHAWIGGLSVLALAALTVFTGASVQRQVRRAQLREDLAASVSHELKTPLSSMRLLVESLLEDDPPDAAKTRDYLNLMARENQRLSRLVDNFLTLSRVERSRNPLDRETLPASEIAARTIAAARETGIGARLVANISEPLPNVRVPPDAFITALLNLLDNAAKYSPAESAIVFKVSSDGNEVAFAITDCGPGLTSRELARVWQAFERGPADAATPGCGLGLAIVRSIATQCGGRADADSTPGHGSTFRVILPSADFEPQKNAENAKKESCA